MERLDNPKFLLFIEPNKEQKSFTAINAELVEVMKLAFGRSVRGVSNYSRVDEAPHFRKGSGKMGVHKTDCGQKSTTNDYLLENGMITNSLCVFYLEYYREAIPESEMKKIVDLIHFYRSKNMI